MKHNYKNSPIAQVSSFVIDPKLSRHKVISVNLPGLPRMSGTIKNKNISKYEGVITEKLTLKDARGGQHKVKRITIEGMDGWEAWQTLQNGTRHISIYNTLKTNKDGEVDYSNLCVGWLWSNGLFEFKKSKIVHAAEGWSIAQAMRYAYIMSQKQK